MLVSDFPHVPSRETRRSRAYECSERRERRPGTPHSTDPDDRARGDPTRQRINEPAPTRYYWLATRSNAKLDYLPTSAGRLQPGKQASLSSSLRAITANPFRSTENSRDPYGPHRGEWPGGMLQLLLEIDAVTVSTLATERATASASSSSPCTRSLSTSPTPPSFSLPSTPFHKLN